MEDKQRNIIIGVVVVVLLCCCCSLIGMIGWFYGDQIAGSLSRAIPSLMTL